MGDYDLERYRDSIIRNQRDRNKIAEEKAKKDTIVKKEMMQIEEEKMYIARDIASQKRELEEIKIEERKNELAIRSQADLKKTALQLKVKAKTDIHIQNLKSEAERDHRYAEHSHQQMMALKEAETRLNVTHAENFHTEEMKHLDFHYGELSKETDFKYHSKDKKTDYINTKRLKKVDSSLEIRRQNNDFKSKLAIRKLELKSGELQQQKEHLQQQYTQGKEHLHTLKVEEYERDTYTHKKNIDTQAHLIESKEAERSFLVRSETENRILQEQSILNSDLRITESREADQSFLMRSAEEERINRDQSILETKLKIVESEVADQSFLMRSAEEERAKKEIIFVEVEGKKEVIRAETERHKKQETYLTKEIKERAKIEKDVIGYKTICEMAKMKLDAELKVYLMEQQLRIFGKPRTENEIEDYIRENRKIGQMTSRKLEDKGEPPLLVFISSHNGKHSFC